MVIGGERPTGYGMTIIALHRGDEMACRFAGGRDPIVARRTRADDQGVIEVGRDPGDGGMTAIAIGGGLHMTDVLASGRGAVMTTGAGGADAGMVKPYIAPRSGNVAIIAGIAGGQMIGRFA